MSRTADPTSQDFVPFATAALDFHRALNLPGAALVTSRAELDSLHAHLVSVYGLLDAHASRTGTLVPIEGEQLRIARVRIWQAADHVHAAFHAAPRSVSGERPGREACRAGLPEGAPELTICQRHQRTARLLRRSTTPADLHAPFTGFVLR
ncbi:DUF6238 family protein [Streptomyces sp. NPDC004838]